MHSLKNNFAQSSTPEWRTAMEEECNSLQSNKVWKLEELPNGTKLLKGKWHFAVKYNADGTVNKYKVRFLAKGFFPERRCGLQ